VAQGEAVEGEAAMSDPESTGNSETVSKKPRRGRPPLFEPEHDAATLPIWSDKITTKRSLRNKQYAVRGLQAISPDGGDKPNLRHNWFAGDGKNYRQAILMELGRIAARYGDAAAMTMADKVVDGVAAGDFTTTREATAWLRRARLTTSEKPAQASADALERLVITTIKNYLADHPDATVRLVEEALCGAAKAFGAHGLT
jgi:hypothetical protein